MLDYGYDAAMSLKKKHLRKNGWLRWSWLYANKLKPVLWQVGQGREPWERSKTGGVNDNERHLHHSPVSSLTEELRKNKRRCNNSERQERTRPGLYFVFSVRQSFVRGWRRWAGVSCRGDERTCCRPPRLWRDGCRPWGSGGVATVSPEAGACCQPTIMRKSRESGTPAGCLNLKGFFSIIILSCIIGYCAISFLKGSNK